MRPTPHALFNENTKMADALLANGRLLYVLPYFGMEPGFEEKTIGQMCSRRVVSTPLFLLVCNLYSFEGYVPGREELRQISVVELIEYLQKSHRNMIEERIPKIMEGVLRISRKSSPEGGEMIAAFCEKYRWQIASHLRYEREVLFPYFLSRYNGEKPDARTKNCEVTHQDIEVAMANLKNVIVKFLPCTLETGEYRSMLLDLFDFDYELGCFSKLEDMVFAPILEYLESGRRIGRDGVEFSERERETLIEIARGLSNKQIAEKLNLSPHTVITHRRNIFRKTGINTASALVLYALFNNFITKDDL